MRRFAAIALSAALAACAGPPSAPYAQLAPLPPAQRAYSLLGSHIKHVVIIVQENRSFDNIFSGFPGADAPTYGIDINGDQVPLEEWGFTATIGEGPPHGWLEALEEWNNGAMNNWAIDPYAPYALFHRLPREQVRPYWKMAHDYVLADRMFPTEFGPSFTSHLNLIAGTTVLSTGEAIVDIPHRTTMQGGWGCHAPKGAYTYLVDSSRDVSYDGPYPCYDQFRTMADTLDAARISWRFYAPTIGSSGGIWSEFQAIKNVYYGPDWRNDVISPQTRVLIDARNDDLAAVSWVIPDGHDSDHPAAHSATGPSWVASVVNAIGKSKEWDSTAIFILWDDWGGWYDDASPPQLNYRGLGIRVPCIIVSPYARRGYVSHTVYEFGSILRFIEDAFALPRLGTVAAGYTDGRANSPVDAFDFTAPPRKFVAIPAPYGPEYFLERPPSGLPPDND